LKFFEIFARARKSAEGGQIFLKFIFKFFLEKSKKREKARKREN